MTDTPWDPPLQGTEAEQVLAALDRLRATFRYKTDGLDAAGLSRRIGASMLTLGGLLKHLALVEDHTFGEKLTGAPVGTRGRRSTGTPPPTGSSRPRPGTRRARCTSCGRRRRPAARAGRPGLADGGLDQPVHASIEGEHANLRRLVCDMIQEYGWAGIGSPDVRRGEAA